MRKIAFGLAACVATWIASSAVAEGPDFAAKIEPHRAKLEARGIDVDALIQRVQERAQSGMARRDVARQRLEAKGVDTAAIETARARAIEAHAARDARFVEQDERLRSTLTDRGLSEEKIDSILSARSPRMGNGFGARLPKDGATGGDVTRGRSAVALERRSGFRPDRPGLNRGGDSTPATAGVPTTASSTGPITTGPSTISPPISPEPPLPPATGGGSSTPVVTPTSPASGPARVSTTRAADRASGLSRRAQGRINRGR